VNGGFLPDKIAASGFGIVIDGGAQRNQVIGCYCYGNGLSGLLLSGSGTAQNQVLSSRFDGNLRSAILIDNAQDNIIGQPGAAGNIFLRAVEAAIRISGPSASGNRVTGNTIGAAGVSTNKSHGVLLDSGAHHNRIGGARSRQPKFETVPQVFVPLREADRAAGNLISGNGGDGIRIDGSHSNLVAGNLIGFSDGDRITPGNGGNGVAIVGGSHGNRIGDSDAHPKYSNQINHNSGAGVLVAGASTSGNSIMRNSIFDNAGGYIVLQDGANNSRPIPDAQIDAVAARIYGAADVAGYVELFSTFIDDPGIFHLRAFVQKGEYMIDQLKPELSQNAVLIESPRPIRLGDQFLSFTAATTGDTSEFYTSSSTP
jgi:parallel beta-helix repeat protein